MSAPIRSRLLTGTPVEEHGLLMPVPWVGLGADTGAGVNELAGTVNGVASVSGCLFGGRIPWLGAASASHTGSGYPASNTVDEDTGTEWRSGINMLSAVIQLDYNLGYEATLDKIRFLQNSSTDWSDSVKVYWSDDGSGYTLSNTFSSLISGWNDLAISEAKHQYWRIEDNSTRSYWWRVQETEFYGSVCYFPAATVQVARVSAQALVHDESPSTVQVARVSAQALVRDESPPTVQVARVSVQALLYYPPPAGYVDGVATVTGDLTQVFPPGECQGFGNGTSTVTGTLTIVVGPTAYSDGVATSIADLEAIAELSGTSGGTSTVTNSTLLTPYNELIGSSNGVAAVTKGLLTEIGPRTWTAPGYTTWTVPGTITEITVSVWGGGGGGGGGGDYGGSSMTAGGGDGAGGGFARSVIPVTPLETLDIHVGGGGETTNDRNDGGGGGGFSAVKRSGAELIVAGGGGGGGGGGANKSGGDGGVGGGIVGGAGQRAPSGGLGGTGGGQAVAGLAGTGYYPGADGTADQGGGGGSTTGSPRPAGGSQGGGDGGWGSPYGIWQKNGGGGGGGGIYGGGGGGGNNGAFLSDGGGGGGGGANTFTGTDQYGETAINRVVGGVAEDGYPGGGQGWGGKGGLNTSGYFIGTEGEPGVVYIEWDIQWPPAGLCAGTSTVSGTLDPLAYDHILEPIPYDLSVDAGGVHELEASTAGSAWVEGSLKVVNESTATSDGVATVTGTLTNADLTTWDGTSNGSATVQGTLLNGTGDVYPIELEGRSDGVGFVKSVWSIKTTVDPIDQARRIYQYVNVGIGFVGDLYNGGGGTVVSYNDPDGDPTRDWDRHLTQLVNVGVSFYDTDDILTRTVGDIADGAVPVTQIFNDGYIRDDWDRHLYQFLQVIEKVESPGRLTIGPSPTRPTFLPPTKPPVSRVGRGPEVV